MVARITLTGVTEPKWPLGERRERRRKKGDRFSGKNIMKLKKTWYLSPKYGELEEKPWLCREERERDTNNISTKNLNINHKWLSVHALDWVVKTWNWEPIQYAPPPFYRRRGYDRKVWALFNRGPPMVRNRFFHMFFLVHVIWQCIH